MGSTINHDSDETTTRRIEAIQRWLAAKSMEVRGKRFYGEVTATLKFEDGQCVLGEQYVRERMK
jgi:hypothetical protein